MAVTLTNIQVSKDYGFGVAKQTNEYTAVSPTNHIAVKSLSMTHTKEFIDASGSRGTNEVLANDYLDGLTRYEGEVMFPAIPNFFTTILEGVYGNKGTSGAGTNMNVFRHANDPNRLTMTGNFGLQEVRWDGCVVNRCEVSSSAGADLVCTLGFMGRQATYTSTIAETANKANRVQRAFQHRNVEFTAYGVSLPISEFSLEISRPNVNVHHGNSQEPVNLIVERPTEMTGRASLPWSTQANTLFSNFRNFTSGQITAHYTRGTHQLRFICPQVVITEAPLSPLSDISVQPFEFTFKCLAPTNQDACKIEVTSAS